jgi:hypothetical protein
VFVGIGIALLRLPLLIPFVLVVSAPFAIMLIRESRDRPANAAQSRLSRIESSVTTAAVTIALVCVIVVAGLVAFFIHCWNTVSFSVTT